MNSKTFAVFAAVVTGWLGMAALALEIGVPDDLRPLASRPDIHYWLCAGVFIAHYFLIPIFMGAVLGAGRGGAFFSQEEDRSLGFIVILGCLTPVVFIGMGTSNIPIPGGIWGLGAFFMVISLLFP